MQVAETCADDNPYQVITATSVNGAYESDQHAVTSTLDQLEDSSTNQELKGRHGLGDLRIRGKPAVELSATLKATALNVKRSVLWHVSRMAEVAPCACATC